MFSALQAALGTWPNEKLFNPATDAEGSAGRFGVKETFAFGGDHGNEAEDLHSVPNDDVTSSRKPVFELLPNTMTQRKEVIPPYFLPPGVTETGELHSGRPGSTGKTSVGTFINTIPDKVHPMPENLPPTPEVSPDEDGMDVDSRSRSLSPPPTDDAFEEERRSLWSTESRNAFHEMVTAEGYVNRYRMHMKKYQRMVHCLEHPDLDPMLCDGTKDHQTKFQAANWTLIDGRLYRKPETGRVNSLRRHLDESEAWDVLTREHLISGHLGRDKLRKRLEQNYIGYTLQEIMFVLKECKRCNGGNQNHDPPIDRTLEPMQSQPESQAQNEASEIESMGPFFRKQTSNMMFP